MNDVKVGFSLGLARLRGLSAPLVLLLSCAAVFVFGVLLRRADAASAADRVLTGAVFGAALPLLAYAVSERLCNGQRLDESVAGLARHGSDRRAALLGLLLASALCTAFSSALLTVVALLGAHTPGAATLSADLRSSVSVALLSGAVYALWFGAASLYGKRGGGRRWALIFDFVLGAGSSTLAAPWPRGHVRNLLGGEPVLDLTQAHAWLVLAAIGALSVVLSVTRAAE